MTLTSRVPSEVMTTLLFQDFFFLDTVHPLWVEKSIGRDSLDKACRDFCIAHRFLNRLHNCCNYNDMMAALLKFKVKSWEPRYVEARVSFGSEGREGFALNFVLRVCQMAFV